jgi:hypothetical protein
MCESGGTDQTAKEITLYECSPTMREHSFRGGLWALTTLLFSGPVGLFAQIDPINRNLIELG